jgi:hypothetical protein
VDVKCANFGMLTVYSQFLNGAGNSPKDRVALSIIEMVGSFCQLEIIV